MSNSKHDVNTYSPEGRLYQIEYAMKASNLGTAIIGVVTRDSVILVSEKKLTNPLQKIDSIKKHYKVFDHIAFGYSGIAGDAKSIVDIARELSLRHMRLYNEDVSAEFLLHSLCSLSLKFSEKDASRKIFSRPFGSSILLAAYEDEPKLYLLEPSGSYKRFKAKALGSAAQSLEGELVKIVEDIDDTQTTISNTLKALKEVMRDPLTHHNVEVLSVGSYGVKMFTPDEIKDILQ
jgi:20S proteasome subunit alpha 5